MQAAEAETRRTSKDCRWWDAAATAELSDVAAASWSTPARQDLDLIDSKVKEASMLGKDDIVEFILVDTKINARANQQLVRHRHGANVFKTPALNTQQRTGTDSKGSCRRIAAPAQSCKAAQPSTLPC